MRQFNRILHETQHMSLLYVEDNPDAREMTVLILRELFGEVRVAVNGTNGLAEFLARPTDMILTDLNMPELSGMAMLEKIREHDQQVPAVVLTAHNDEEHLLGSIAAGVDGYLIKPINMDALLELLSRIVVKHRFLKEQQAKLTFLEAHQEATTLNTMVSKTDPRGVITYVNDAFCDVSGYRREELIGRRHNLIRHPDNAAETFRAMWETIRIRKEVWRGILRNRTKNGKSYYVDGVIMPVVDGRGEIIEYISSQNNITEIMRPSEQLQNALKQFREQALIYLKMKSFDVIEGFYDTEMLERIQAEMAFFLQEAFASTYEFDRIYPLGNGEFALLVSHPEYDDHSNNAVFVAELKRLQHTLEEKTLRVAGATVSAAVLVSLVYTNERILESAKFGIRKMVETDKDFIIANHLAARQREQAEKNMAMVAKIQQALTESRVLSCFQPIVDNRTGAVVKYESLVRLMDREEAVHAPEVFLDISKKCGCYPQITEKVLENSFAMLHHTDITVTINISVADIEHRPTRRMILRFLRKNKEQASRIVFELLEDEMTRNYQRIHAFATEVKNYGARIAIDDFGAGYSNYERLLSYRPDILKIDGSLIRTLDRNSYSLSIVKSIVTFAREQGLETVAEFVENETIFEIVKELGIEYSQGYLFGKPQYF